MRKGLRLLFVLLAGLVLGACGERTGREINGGIAVLETAPRKTETRPVRGVPETRGVLETQKVPETGKEPETWKVPETRKVPETQGVPEMRGISETQKAPETREVPETRGMSETRKAAETPETPETPTSPAAPENGGDAEVDLTVLSSIMVYSEIWNMMKAPENYIGKTIKMRGQFVCAGEQEEGKRYFGCLVADAAQCCSQGLEFVLAGDHVYPDDYPALNSRITVTGTFETYQVKGIEYCRIVDAVLECESN